MNRDRVPARQVRYFQFPATKSITMMLHRALHHVLAAAILGATQSFVVVPAVIRSKLPRRMSEVTMNNDDDDDEEDVAPGEMRVSEIKSELDMRGIGYVDCFDKEALVDRLKEARATGRSNPDILSDFNKKKLEENFSGKKVEISDEDIDRIKANDGTLPGGMSPDMLKSLMGNPELMALLQSPKMQEAMTLMMTGGREDLEKAIAGDPELQKVVEKLNNVMGGTM